MGLFWYNVRMVRKNRKAASANLSVLDLFAFPSLGTDLADMLGRTPEVNASPDERRRVKATSADGVEGIVSFGYSRYRKYRPHLPEHVHPGCFEINFCQRGVLAFEAGGTAYTVKPGHVFISKPGEPHHLTTNIKGLFLYWMLLRFPERDGGSVLGLSAAETAALQRRLAAIASPCFPVQEDVRLLFQDMFKAYRMPKRDALRSIRLKSTILQILLSILRDSSGNPRRIFQSAIVQAMQQIADHPEQPYTLADLARQANLSLSRFSALFKQATGLPPHKMIMMQRLDKAKRLLLETDMPVSNICYSLGFATPRHFASQFKATFGITATECRRKRPSSSYGCVPPCS